MWVQWNKWPFIISLTSGWCQRDVSNISNATLNITWEQKVPPVVKYCSSLTLMMDSTKWGEMQPSLWISIENYFFLVQENLMEQFLGMTLKLMNSGSGKAGLVMSLQEWFIEILPAIWCIFSNIYIIYILKQNLLCSKEFSEAHVKQRYYSNIHLDQLWEDCCSCWGAVELYFWADIIMKFKPVDGKLCVDTNCKM